MKKTLSILMSILIIALSFVFCVSAGNECNCLDHKPGNNKDCTCCVFCDNLDEHWVTSCVKVYDEQGNLVIDGARRCCTECTGIIPCPCGHPCCPTDTAAEAPGAGGNGEILTPDQQEQVVEGFQAVLGRIREFFDKLFDAIFEFLRFDEIMGNN